MSKYRFLIWGLLGMSLVSQAAAQSAAPRIQPEQAILAPIPSTPQMAAFESRTAQKWEDFLAYLSLISQAGTEVVFREYTREEALKLFVQGETPVQAWDGSPMPDFLTRLLQKGAGQTFVSVPGSFDLEGFYPAADGFSGYAQVQIKEKNSNRLESLVVAVFLQRERKAFGQQVETVWEVKLGSVSRQ